MSEEVTVEARLKSTVNNFHFDRKIGPLKFDQATEGGGNPGTVNLTAGVDTALDLSALTTPTWAILRNVSADGTGSKIQVGPDSGGAIVPLIEVEDGQPSGPIRLVPGVTVRAQAIGVDASLQFEALEA